MHHNYHAMPAWCWPSRIHDHERGQQLPAPAVTSWHCTCCCCRCVAGAGATSSKRLLPLSGGFTGANSADMRLRNFSLGSDPEAPGLLPSPRST